MTTLPDLILPDAKVGDEIVVVSTGWKLERTKGDRRRFEKVKPPVIVPGPPPATVPVGGDLQAALTAAPNGGFLKTTPGAIYELRQSWRHDLKRGLRLDLTGSTIDTNLPPGKAFAGTQELTYFKDWEDCTILGGTFFGSHDKPGTYYTDGREFQAGVAFFGGARNRVIGTVVRNNMGDGVGVYGGAEDIAFAACESHGNGRMGIAVTNAQHVLWDGGLMSDQAWVCFEVEPDPNGTDKVTDVVFRNATVSGKAKHLFAVSMVGGCERITCEGMLVKAGPNYGIWSFIEPKDGQRNRDITFRNNVGETPIYEDPGWVGVLLAKDTDNLVATGNVQPVKQAAMGRVLMQNSNGVTSPNSFPVRP